MKFKAHKLEVSFAVALIALIIQLHPVWMPRLQGVLDIRNWSGGIWLSVSSCILLALLIFRFGPEVYSDFKDRCECQNTEREQRALKKDLQDRREMLERVRTSRSRRIF